MTSSKGIMYFAALVLLSFAHHAATGSNANDDRTTTHHAVTVNTNGENAVALSDFDGDGTIGFGDFLLFAGVFGSRQGDDKYEAKYDLNGDGEIGFADFLIFAQNFGKEVPSPAVSIPNTNLRAVIEAALGKESGAPITQAEIATLDSLEASDADIADLTGLELATNMEHLYLAGNNISDISVLEGLTNLRDLILSSNDITDLASLVANRGLGTGDTVDVTNNPLNPASESTHIPALRARGVSVSYVPSPVVAIPDANLRAAIEAALGKATGAPITLAEMRALNSLNAPNYTNGPGIRDLTGLETAANLTRLVLLYNTISDLSPLSGLTNLAYLDLTEIRGSVVSGADRISPLQLSPLSGLTNLTYLDLSQNKISDLSPLSGLINLTYLNLHRNSISDLSSLSGLTKLTYLNLSQNKISDVSPLAGLTQLREVILSINDISDLSPLAANAGLGSGDTVDVRTNPLDDASKTVHIPALRARGVNIDFDEAIAITEPQIYNDNVFVLPVTENLAGEDLPLVGYSARFYAHFKDEFDFLMFVTNVPGERGAGRAFYASVKNDVTGIGISIFSENSRWGSAGKLQGVVNFGSNSIYSISDRGMSIVSEGPTLHELMHRWANSIVPSSWGGHWGFSSANGVIGGFDMADLVNHGGGRYSAGSFNVAGSADNVELYSPIELYLAGFIPPNEVPDLWVAEDGEWLRDTEGGIVKDSSGNPVFTASRVRTYTIEDIIAKHGPRVPDHFKAQKDFRAVVILLITDAYPATREILETVSRDVSWLSHAGTDESHRYNFYEATGGRATITMDGLSRFQRRAGAKTVAPSSFGTPPPPIVDHWD